jgi:hypothetical protein
MWRWRILRIRIKSREYKYWRVQSIVANNENQIEGKGKIKIKKSVQIAGTTTEIASLTHEGVKRKEKVKKVNRRLTEHVLFTFSLNKRCHKSSKKS